MEEARERVLSGQKRRQGPVEEARERVLSGQKRRRDPVEEGEVWREGGKKRIIYKREGTYKRVLHIELSMREQTIFMQTEATHY